MERIYLTKNEKRVIRLVANKQERPETYPEHIYIGSILSLERKGFITGAYSEGGKVIDVRMSPFGRAYLFDNPNLRNPLPWGAVWAAVAAFAAVAGLFVGCTLLK